MLCVPCHVYHVMCQSCHVHHVYKHVMHVMLCFQVAVVSPTLTDHITDLNDNITSIKFDQLFDPTMTTDNQATTLLQLLGSTTSRTIDACMSFDPHTVPFASRVHHLLGLPGGTNDSGARTVLDRLATQRMLTTRNDAIPQWPPSHLYSALVRTQRVRRRRWSDHKRCYRAVRNVRSSERPHSNSDQIAASVSHLHRRSQTTAHRRRCRLSKLQRRWRHRSRNGSTERQTEPVDHRFVSMLQRDELDQRSVRRSDDVQRDRSKADRDRALPADDVSPAPVLPPSSIVLWGGFDCMRSADWLRHSTDAPSRTLLL